MDLVVPRAYCCFKCGNRVCFHDDIMDKNYVWGINRAFFFCHAMNIVTGPKEKRRLITGSYIIADVYCSDCREQLGWKYYKATEEQHKHKEGKFAIIKYKIDKENW